MHQHGLYRNGNKERTGLITSVGATEVMPPADARAVQRKMLLRNAQPGSKNAEAFLNLWQGLTALPFVRTEDSYGYYKNSRD